MAWFTNLRIGARLGIVFGVVLLLMTTLGVVGVVELKKIAGTSGTNIDHALDHGDELANVRVASVRMEASFVEAVLSGREVDHKRYLADAKDLRVKMRSLLGHAEPFQRPNILRAQATALRLEKLHDRVIELNQTGHAGSAKRILQNQIVPIDHQLDKYTSTMGAEYSKEIKHTAGTASRQAGFIASFAIWFTALSVLVAAGLAWFVTRGITAPLRRLEQASATAAEGDLTVRADATGKDEVGAVGRAFNAMVSSTHDVVAKVAAAAAAQSRSSRELALASGQAGEAVSQVAVTIDEIARGASEQAETTQRVSQTVHEMSDGVASVAAGGQSAAQAAHQTDSTAQGGVETVHAATEAMQRIENSVSDAAEMVAELGRKSQEIGQIVDTISGIAAQTNLLALNAAIEAARAGDQGRGFAVVAEEVRQLAEDSQHQAQSIAAIIGDVQKQTDRAVEAMASGREEVAAGSERVASAGRAFDAIRDQVATLVSEVGQVAAAAQQLGAGARQVQEDVTSVASVSQENAAATQQVSASTEETSATSSEIARTADGLSGQAQELAELVSRFRV